MIEPGDLVRHIPTGGTYEVLSLVSFAGYPHAIVTPVPREAGPAVPVPIENLELVSKGGIQ